MKGPTGDQVRPMRVRPLRVRPMEAGDIPRVMEIADGLPHAPHWPVSAYEAALNPKSEPRRIAVVAEAPEPRSCLMNLDGPEESIPQGLKPASLSAFCGTTQVVPFQNAIYENSSSQFESGAVVGFVVASLVAGEAELESIAVAAGAQRCGLGGQLLEHLLAALREVRVNRINLEVRASNGPALALYKRHGFIEMGRRVGYYVDPVEDAVLMGLDPGWQKGG